MKNIYIYSPKLKGSKQIWGKKKNKKKKRKMKCSISQDEPAWTKFLFLKYKSIEQQ